MKLDRNTNPDGSGKYALLKIRAINQLRADHDGKLPGDVFSALEVLGQRGLIHWGNEGPGEQFFVMKYKDKFAAPALDAYKDAVLKEAWNVMQSMQEVAAKAYSGEPVTDDEKKEHERRGAQYRSLMQYAGEISAESSDAELYGRQIPD